MQTGGTTATLGHIIFSHLALHGYWGSAAAVARDMLGGSVVVAPSKVQEFEARLRVREAIVGGDMDAALAAAEAFQPGALAASPNLLQRVKCQKFVELVGSPHAWECTPSCPSPSQSGGLVALPAVTD